MIGQILSEVTIPGITGFNLKIPDPGGFFSGGLLSGFGTILQIAFGLTLTIWIILSLIAGYKIIQSQGNPDQIKEGMTRIKYLWISVSVFFGFFIVISIVGVVVGFGSPVEWGNTLAQCGGYDGPFYFAQVDQQTAIYSSKFGVKASSVEKGYCCMYNAAKNDYRGVFGNPLQSASDLGISNDGPNWYLPMPSNESGYKTEVVQGNVQITLPSGSSMTNTGFTDCHEYGK